MCGRGRSHRKKKKIPVTPARGGRLPANKLERPGWSMSPILCSLGRTGEQLQCNKVRRYKPCAARSQLDTGSTSASAAAILRGLYPLDKKRVGEETRFQPA